ncbi:hypothetical protein EON68_02250 [archaeon]|nr:MAG: hypothetical protein EON68_02250 [archaeon]
MALRRASSLGSAGSAAVGGSDAYPRAAIDAARPPRNDDAAAAGSDAASGTAATAAAAATAGVAATRADVLHRKVSMKAAAYAEQRAAAVAAAPVLEDLGDKSRGMDIDRWRKKVGITAATRVFIITGEYPDIRDALVARGWKQNPDKESPHFDMKWTLKSNEISHGALLAAQYANHCQRATCITTKAGLTHTIRVAHHFTPVDYNTFFPRAYDLGDPQDYADFVDDFRGVEAEKVVRGVVLSLLNALLGAGCISLPQLQLTTTSGRAGGRVSQADQVMTRIMTARAELLEKVLLQPAVLSNVSHPAVPLVNHGVLAAALSVCRKRQREWDDADLDAPGEAGLEPAVTAREWEVLRHCSVFREGAPVEQAPLTRADEEAARALELAMNIKRDRLIRRLAKRGKTDAATLTAVLQQSSVSGLATRLEQLLQRAACPADGYDTGFHRPGRCKG